VSVSGLVTVRAYLDRLLYSITETLATLASGVKGVYTRDYRIVAGTFYFSDP
jgi:hypothetical protein